MNLPTNLKIIEGDLLEHAFEHDAIAHGANCHCTMGAGIAKQIRIKFPQMEREDNRTNRIPVEQKIGTFTKARIGHVTHGYNLYTQIHTGPDFNRMAFAKAMTGMCLDVVYYDAKTIGLPMIGCGIGGFNEDEFIQMVTGFALIYPMIEFTIYKYQPQSKSTDDKAEVPGQEVAH